MIEFLSRFLHAAVLTVLALLAVGMALAFMFSTAIAVAVLYVVARLRGKHFGVRSYWTQRRQAYGFMTRPFGSSSGNPRGARRAARSAEIIDVELREVH